MVPFVGPAYDLKVRKADCQRSVNLMPTLIESGTGKAGAFLKPVPGLTTFSGDPCVDNNEPDSAVFSLLRFDVFPLVETVALNEYLEDPAAVGEPAEPFSGAPLIRCSTGALDCVRNNNGRVIDSWRTAGNFLSLAEDGFTVEMFLYREGGDAYYEPENGRDSWEWSGTVSLTHSGTADENSFSWYWHGGQNWGGTSYIGHTIQDGALFGNEEAALTMPDGVWTHVSWVFDNDEVRCYVAGVLIYTTPITGGTVTTADQFVSTTFDVYYGETHPRAADEFRTTGRVRYTGASFTPPTHAFPDPNP